MLNVIDRRGERPFLRKNHSLRHLIGWQPGELPDHADDRDVDRRKNIGRRLCQNKGSHQEQQ